MAGIPPPPGGPTDTLLARYKPLDLPTFSLVKADILQLGCDAIVIITDDQLLRDQHQQAGPDRRRPDHCAWRVIANGIPVPSPDEPLSGEYDLES